MNVRLYEIFTSVEGEGILYGTKTLFVRLAGCPFKCFYCDTKDALPMNSGKEYSISKAKEIIRKSLKKNTYKVNFTGGDPLAQSKAVAELAKFVQGKKISTYLESSCYDSSKFAEVLP
ncbi:MAG TPA: 7-carboxy-7-deazaguanine synthase QueE, partial [Candidatus Nitrosotalea sp.]|nr:7-carboxy-7-deazaguanine synthase QueE [Candidatus Nitrosotalea sp.]